MLWKLPFNGQVPLLGIGPPVGIQWTVKDISVAVVEGTRDKWRSQRGRRDSVVDVESGIVLTCRRIFERAEGLTRLYPVRLIPSFQTWVDACVRKTAYPA